MQNLLNELTELLSKDVRLVVDGKLLKNKITELALAMDADLIKLLLENKNIKKHFFTDIEGILVFDKIKFQRFVSNKEFLPDSYTAFKNKIGLVDEQGEYITNKQDVVLAWPYKDCILEGGQTKEDQKREEIFWNETLAPDEIDRLLAPKVFTGWKKYDSKGEHELTGKEKIDFQNENLIIRGNNLLVLHSIYKKYAGKVKLIYIDPPYNTGCDSFKYNDSFNHSSWLSFTKNRLIEAYKLLRKDGAIFVQIDHHELGYVNVLMDEIFGIENKVQIISVKTASPAGFKTVNPGPIDVTEYILFYTKHKPSFVFRKNYVPVGYNKNYNLYLEKNDNIKKWKFIPIKDKVIESSGFKSEKEAKSKYGDLWRSVLQSLIEDFAFNNADNIVSIRDPHKPTQTVKDLMDKSKEVEYVIPYEREDGSTMFLYKGGALAFYSNKKMILDGKSEITEILTDFWDHISWAGIAGEGGVKLKNGKKPEKLLKQIFDIATDKGDIVLDYHLGSGTTCATAHKYGLRYIGIEQLNYGENDSIKRLQNVINNDQTGISKAVNWKGGGSFIYCELMEWNEAYISKIKKAKSSKELITLWEEMQTKAFISYKIDPKTINENITDFKELSIEDQKRFLIEILDKNQLYVNYSEIDDKDYQVSETDKKINRMFYGEV
jgi:adenine-specific DNA-methyltransferase